MKPSSQWIYFLFGKYFTIVRTSSKTWNIFNWLHPVWSSWRWYSWSPKLWRRPPHQPQRSWPWRRRRRFCRGLDCLALASLWIKMITLSLQCNSLLSFDVARSDWLIYSRNIPSLRFSLCKFHRFLFSDYFQFIYYRLRLTFKLHALSLTFVWEEWSSIN